MSSCFSVMLLYFMLLAEEMNAQCNACKSKSYLKKKNVCRNCFFPATLHFFPFVFLYFSKFSWFPNLYCCGRLKSPTEETRAIVCEEAAVVLKYIKKTNQNYLLQ